ncbi:GlsB/YeaQ/YmgE family stress response membrane protein [Micromonospora globbae]|uniref:GlsB/YeaQ/YmgE family stress response membrane protein n=1 Tax=Micromonospora globbae TaxID=1894969 RepID=A0A420EJQ5_9ACTN|nr:GlsB/YeaQ/YmgE family stress response membrane protein [Micromonospora globbae]RKF20951.1 GlsB/YeaQ/YmgE family stress response membrane protein [Micromonospora globbae]
MNPPNPIPGPAETRSPLERRYRRLLRAYPRRYQAERGEEIVGTYLDLVGPQRRWPSPRDALDLLRAGLRERLRAYGALGLADALPLAATAALNTLIALAAFLFLQVELNDPRITGLDPVGPFQTLGAAAWLGWLLVGLTATTLPGRWARYAAAAGLLLTIALPPAAALTGQPRPPLFVLIPTVALGLTALALPTHPSWVGRSLPPLAAGFGTAVSVSFAAAENGGNWFTSYRSTPEILAMVGGLMFALVLIAGLGRALRADDAGLWAALLLATPAGLFGANQLSQAIAGSRSGAPSLTDFATTTVAILLTGAALLAAAIASQAARQRTVRQRALDSTCPTCGHRPDATARTRPPEAEMGT